MHKPRKIGKIRPANHICWKFSGFMEHNPEKNFLQSLSMTKKPEIILPFRRLAKSCKLIYRGLPLSIHILDSNSRKKTSITFDLSLRNFLLLFNLGLQMCRMRPPRSSNIPTLTKHCIEFFTKPEPLGFLFQSPCFAVELYKLVTCS